MTYYGDFPIDALVYMTWGSYDGGTGASVTQTGLIAADVIIFKNGAVAQKTSTNGIAVNNDFDGRTGLHLISIDTSNDTGDAGWWVAGADYQVAIDAVTIDGQTVRMWIGHFSCENRSSASPGDAMDLVTDAIDTASLATTGLADINAEVDTALGDYDAPTKAELDAGLGALNDLTAAQVNAEVDTALADYDAPTKAELDAGLAALNDLTAAQVNAEVDTALSDYDAPTKAELDAGLAALNDPTLAAIVAGLWDELTATARTAGSYGQLLIDNLDAAISSRAATGAAMDLITDALDAASIASSGADEIWGETLSELGQGKPSATPTARNALMLLYMMARDLVQIDASEMRLYNDAGVCIWKKALSDDATTYAEAEAATGP